MVGGPPDRAATQMPSPVATRRPPVPRSGVAEPGDEYGGVVSQPAPEPRSSETSSPHMTPEEFRRHGHEVVDWIADYWTRLPGLPVRSPVAPGDVRALLPDAPPEHGEPVSAIVADLDRVVVPGLTHWQHPGFFGYFPANTSGPSVLGDLVSAGLGIQGMSWVTSPAATELEQHVLDWFAELLGLPQSFRSTGTGGGVVQDSSSGANLVALLAALHRASGGATVRHGVVPEDYTVYVSAETHSSMEKAVRVAGLGSDAVRIVEVGEDLAMRPAALAARLERDVARGLKPVLVCATVGTTSTTAVDPLAELGPICQRFGVWLHVDAAYAGVSGLVPELRPLQDGVEWADSYTTDAHKWLLTGFDATLFWVGDRQALTGALAILPEYLRNAATDGGAVVDYRDWQIELGRRFRALKLWFVVRWYGAEGLRAHIRSGVALAQELAGWATDDGRFDVATAHPLSLVCLRPLWPDDVDADVATMTLLERLNDGGEVFLTHTTVRGQVVLRVAVGAPTTTREHVERAWQLLCENHDWLSRDFAEQAAERARVAAEQRVEAERRAAERAAERAAAEAQQAAEAAEARQAAEREAAEALQDAEPAVEADVPGGAAVEADVPGGAPVEVAVEVPAAQDETAAQAAAQESLTRD